MYKFRNVRDWLNVKIIFTIQLQLRIANSNKQALLKSQRHNQLSFLFVECNGAATTNRQGHAAHFCFIIAE